MDRDVKLHTAHLFAIFFSHTLYASGLCDTSIHRFFPPDTTLMRLDFIFSSKLVVYFHQQLIP